MRFDVPGRGPLIIETIILDLNGTLSVGGVIQDGVGPRLAALRDQGVDLVLLTGNTRNDADRIAGDLGIRWSRAATAEEKRDIAISSGASTCASIGNGLIDVELMKVVELGIATLQAEGVHVATLLECDIVVPTIRDALDLFLDRDRMIATLRR